MSPGAIGRVMAGQCGAARPASSRSRRRCAPPAAPPGCACCATSTGRVIVDLGFVVRQQRGPEFDAALGVCRDGRDGRSPRRARSGRRAPLRFRTRVSTNARISGAERREVISGCFAKALLGAGDHCPAKWWRLMSNWAGIGALEAEDGLFLVAHREDGAQLAALAACAGEEFLRQRFARSPIARGWCPAPRRSAHDRCRHPACRAPRRAALALFQQVQRLHDQIVIVQHARAAAWRLHNPRAWRAIRISAASRQRARRGRRAGVRRRRRSAPASCVR